MLLAHDDALRVLAGRAGVIHGQALAAGDLGGEDAAGLEMALHLLEEIVRVDDVLGSLKVLGSLLTGVGK
jgi:hypothetical protein